MSLPSTALWYASRGTGVVALLLLTTVVVLGIMVSRQRPLPGLPRFASLGLHRYLSLLGIGFIAVHVATAIADPYVNINVAAAVIPFASSYKPLSLGLGAVAFDLIIALIVTSLLRHRLGRWSWRAIHWLAYGSWPVALIHGLGASKDLRSGPLLGLTAMCALAVAAAVVARLAGARREVPRTLRVPLRLAEYPGPGLPGQPPASRPLTRAGRS